MIQLNAPLIKTFTREGVHTYFWPLRGEGGEG